MSKKKIGIIAAIVVVIGIIAVGAIVLTQKNKGFRIVKIYEINGTTTVNRGKKGDMDAYQNMVLQSGDEVFIQKGTTTLKLDDDKYVYGEEDTKFELIAKGTAANSKTTINLLQGAITNEIQNPLSSKSSYEVNTQNSNMSVHGTIYRVEVYFDENGVQFTRLSVFQGEVSSKLIMKDGTISDEEVMIPAGKEVIIYQDEKATDYYSDVHDIDYSTLPPEVLEWLVDMIENGTLELPVSVEELNEMIEELKEPGPFTVTFMYGGEVFGTQTVENEGFASEPSLMPAPSGKWDYDFSKPITEDTTIEWK